MDQRFPPSHRLHHGRDYSRVFNRQHKAAGRHVVVLLRAREERALDARLGIMVAVKTVSTAVRRHQLKRWVREFFRTRLHEVVRGYDVVVLFRADPPPEGHQLLSDEISALANKALATKPQGQSRSRDGGRRPAPARQPTGAP
jgi:ribonuclease P protein component